jgi:hypothetical protein
MMIRHTIQIGSLAGLFLLSLSALAQDAPVVDATLDSIRGGQRALHDERGHRVVVLFYEDRPHIEDNERLKGNLLQMIRQNHLERRVVAFGVANLGDLGDSVPHDLVRRMIRPLLDRWGVDILLDWDGVLRRAPFSFETNAANVAIIDRGGHIVFHHAGRVDGDQRTAFYRALRAALRQR